ncbi:dihydropteroate synthase [Methylomicrobium sp. Wu6]|uniref:dihydropteroate synthase n=1 Tax=Methylomicrobium sp. Wu6 TaxID=3107928 RepID=UPI002DD6A275|nr:dihydropteroate synthase [Methylomicrobium sp. Wu6]MEC4747151.1 dihydropteroate synthase [Methylomicrobium sp. Wu6]
MFRAFEKPLIMGILNVTPDSFSDGGKYITISAAVAQAEKMLSDGADIIDIGGESTRPGSDPVPALEQIRRIVPVIDSIKGLSPRLAISIDTTLAEVAEAALRAGADIINDVSGGTGDAKMLTLAARLDAPIVLMHSKGTPKTMQDHPYYQDVVSEVLAFLRERVEAALAVGVKSERILIDPGIGFGKRKQDNFDLLAHLDAFVELGFPVLLGASRKRFMGSLCNVQEPAELVTATAVTTALGVMAGVKLFRVHDVKENRQAADVAWAIRQSRKPVNR